MPELREAPDLPTPARRPIALVALTVLYAFLTVTLLSITYQSINLNPSWLAPISAVVALAVLAGVTIWLVHRLNRQVAQEQRERQRLADALQRNEQRFKSLCTRAGLRYQCLSAAGCLEDVNPAWLEMMGYTRERVIGRWFGDFLTAHSQASFRECLARLNLIGQMNNCLLEAVRGDGTGLAAAGRITDRRLTTPASSGDHSRDAVCEQTPPPARNRAGGGVSA